MKWICLSALLALAAVPALADQPAQNTTKAPSHPSAPTSHVSTPPSHTATPIYHPAPTEHYSTTHYPTTSTGHTTTGHTTTYSRSTTYTKEHVEHYSTSTSWHGMSSPHDYIPGHRPVMLVAPRHFDPA